MLHYPMIWPQHLRKIHLTPLLPQTKGTPTDQFSFSYASPGPALMKPNRSDIDHIISEKAWMRILPAGTDTSMAFGFNVHDVKTSWQLARLRFRLCSQGRFSGHQALRYSRQVFFQISSREILAMFSSDFSTTSAGSLRSLLRFVDTPKHVIGSASFHRFESPLRRVTNVWNDTLSAIK